MEYLSPQGVLLPLVYVTTASPLWLELRGHSALLLSSRSLRRSASSVTLRVANGEMMEGGLEEAEISLDFIGHDELSRPGLG